MPLPYLNLYIFIMRPRRGFINGWLKSEELTSAIYLHICKTLQYDLQCISGNSRKDVLGRRPCCNQLVSPKTSSPSTDYNNYFYNIFNGKNQEVNFFFFFFFSLRCRFSEHMVNRGHLKETTCWQEQHLRGIRSSVEVFMSFPDIYLPQTFICKTLNLPLNLTVLLIA